MRHLTVIAFILLVMCHFEMVSQSCLPDGITFTTQSQIDSFPINYPGCTEIEGYLQIMGDDIVNLDGLSTITSTDGTLAIWDNEALTNLSGLDNLTYVGGNISILDNVELTSIASLNSLSAINGYIAIEENPSLVSLDGLANINSNSIEYIHITHNPSLSHCGVIGLCDFLTSPTGRVRIAYNDFGCSTPSEVANDCGITLPCLPYGEYWLYKQIQIDSFATNYHNCTNLQGGVRIRGDVPNLNGLSGVQSIQELYVEYTDSLTSLLGLSNLEKIEFQFIIRDNESLIDLTGLYSLDSVGANVIVVDNPALTSLIGLDSLIYLDGDLSVRDNSNIGVLDGIDNVKAESIHSLFITGNPKLSKCNVQSICDYLVSPIGKVEIYDNLVGCNSQQEVDEACTVGVPEPPEDVGLSTYPNPFTTSTTIQYELTEPTYIQLTIYNHLGEVVEEAVSAYQLPGVHTYEWSAERLSEGMYFAVLRSGDGVSVVKMVKQ